MSDLKFMKSRKRAGFTLVELLVVIAIMFTLAVAAVQTTIGTQRQFAYEAEFNKVLQTVRQARNLALGNSTVPDVTDDDGDGNTTEGILPQGYGIEIDSSVSPTVMRIFQDVVGTNKYSIDVINNPGPGVASDVVLGEIAIDERFELEGSEDGSPVSKLLLYYETPFGFPAFQGGFDIGYIVLRDPEIGTSSEKTVMVHRESGIPEPKE